MSETAHVIKSVSVRVELWCKEFSGLVTFIASIKSSDATQSVVIILYLWTCYLADYLCNLVL